MRASKSTANCFPRLRRSREYKETPRVRRGGLHPVLSDGIAVRHGELMLEGAVADPNPCGVLENAI